MQRDEGRRRDRHEERDERDRFVVLLHIYTLAKAGVEKIGADRITSDLGLPAARSARLIGALEFGEFVRHTRGVSISITRRGVEFIERVAGRRRSLRMPLHGRDVVTH